MSTMTYSDNPYRVLGIFANDAHAAAPAAMPAHGPACDLSGRDPLVRFAALDRTPDAIAAARAALESTTTRLEARFLWFDVDRDDRNLRFALAAGDVAAADAIWQASGDIVARANAARFFHAIMLERDRHNLKSDWGFMPPQTCSWRTVVERWIAVMADDAFWQRLRALDASLGYLPAISAGEVETLRSHGWDLLLQPTQAPLVALMERGDYGRIRDYVEQRAKDGIPRAALSKLLDRVFEPHYHATDEAIAAALTALANDRSSDMEDAVGNARKAVRRRAIPLIANLTRLAGPDFVPVRRLTDKVAAFLEGLVDHAVTAGDVKLSRDLQMEANNLMRGGIPKTTGGGAGTRKKSSPVLPLVLGGVGLVFIIGIASLSNRRDSSAFDDWSSSSRYQRESVPEEDHSFTTDTTASEPVSDITDGFSTWREALDAYADSMEYVHGRVVSSAVLIDELASQYAKYHAAEKTAASPTELENIRKAEDRQVASCRSEWADLKEASAEATLIMTKYDRAYNRSHANTENETILQRSGVESKYYAIRAALSRCKRNVKGLGLK